MISSAYPSEITLAPDGEVWASWQDEGWRVGHLGPAGWEPLDRPIPPLGDSILHRLYFTDSGNFEEDWTEGRAVGAVYYISPAGELMQIRRGVTTNWNAFFYPPPSSDVEAQYLTPVVRSPRVIVAVPVTTTQCSAR